MPNFISEDDIEQAIVQKLQHLYGYDSMDCHTADPADLNDGSGRRDKREVILRGPLKAAAVVLNPDIPDDVIDKAVGVLCDRRQALSLVNANRKTTSQPSHRRITQTLGPGLVQKQPDPYPRARAACRSAG